MNGTRKCSLDSCPDPAEICFAQQEFCLHHFLFRCYEDLNRFDVRASGSEVSDYGPAALKAFVEECSRCALEVSLQCENLDNLQRGRVLDILLWASELLPKTSADARPGEPLCSRGTQREPFINLSQGSVGRAIVGSGTALRKNAAR